MDPMATYGIIFGREKILEIAKICNPRNPGQLVDRTRLRPRFFAEITTTDPIADGAKIAAPIFLVTGQRDLLVKNGAALAAKLTARRATDTRDPRYRRRSRSGRVQGTRPSGRGDCLHRWLSAQYH